MLSVTDEKVIYDMNVEGGLMLDRSVSDLCQIEPSRNPSHSSSLFHSQDLHPNSGSPEVNLVTSNYIFDSPLIFCSVTTSRCLLQLS